MTFCIWHFLAHSVHEQARYIYDGKSVCEDCLCQMYEDDVKASEEYKKRREEHDKRIEYFDKHGKWPEDKKKQTPKRGARKKKQ